MPKPGFYNDNRNRAFPFVKGTVGDPVAPAIEGLASETIVDAGFVTGVASAFDPTTHNVYLSQIRRQGSTLYFDFTCDAPALADVTLTFTRSVNDEEYSTEYAEAFSPETPSSLSESVSETPCDPEPALSGYLVTGRFDALLEVLTGDGGISRTTGGVVEPALVQSLAGAYVGTLNVGNGDRTRVDAPAGCPPVTWPHATGEGVVFVNASCLRGDIRFKPGYNSVVRQEAASNTLIFGAEVGAGEGQPCEEVPLFPGESPPDGSTLLEGGPKCNDVVRTINGVGGQYAGLLGGTGVRVTQVPELNKIVVDVSMTGLAVCYPSSGFSEVSESL